MKNILLMIIVLVLGTQCNEKDVAPKLMEIEAELGTPFTVSAPAKVTFKEIPIELYVEGFAKSGEFGFVSRNTSVKAIYKNGEYYLPFEIRHWQYNELEENLDSLNIRLLDPDANLFLETALLDSLYLFSFKKAYWENADTPNDADGEILKVDSAVFVMKRKD